MAFWTQILFGGSESFACSNMAVFVTLWFLGTATYAPIGQARGKVVLMHASTP